MIELRVAERDAATYLIAYREVSFGSKMKRPTFILGAFVVGIASLFWYRYLEAPADIATKGNSSDPWTAWIALAVATISLLTAIVGLVQKLIELRATSGQ